MQIEKPLQKHGGRLEHIETYHNFYFNVKTMGSTTP